MNTETDEIVARQVLVLRIIVAALISGVVTFAFVVIFVLWGVVPVNDQFQILTYLGLGMLVVSMGLQSRLDLFEPPVAPAGTPAEELNRWVAGYAQRTIIGAALFEAPAFLCVMGSMLDGRSAGSSAIPGPTTCWPPRCAPRWHRCRASIRWRLKTSSAAALSPREARA